MEQQHLLVWISISQEKNFALQHVFYLAVTSFEEKNSYMGKVAKGKRTNAWYKLYQITWNTSFKMIVYGKNVTWINFIHLSDYDTILVC